MSGHRSTLISTMDVQDIDSIVWITTALLVSLAQLARVVFGTLRSCIKEYDRFRAWLSARHSTHAPGSDRKGEEIREVRLADE